MKFLRATTAVAAIAAGTLTAVATVETSWAATDTAFNYTKPKGGYYSIDPMSLAPDRPSANYLNSWPDGLIMVADGPQCFSTGVNLPQGAIITKVQVTYSSVAGPQPYLELRRKSLMSVDTANVATKIVSLTNDIRRRENMNVNSAIAVIDNAEFSYGFGICPQKAGSKFYGARIIYTYTNASD